MGDSSNNTSKQADEDGHFRRKDSVFRNWISSEPGAKHPPERDRYALYVNYGCPWAHRTIITRGIKSLDPIVQLVLTDFELTENGWLFTGRNGSEKTDPLYGLVGTKQLYLKADPEYQGRYTVPVLWDKKLETIVNNESSEIIRIFYSAFDSFLEPDLREVNKPNGGLLPPHLLKEIDAMNSWVYDTINNGVYKVGFATTQEAYDANIYPLFKSLDRLEAHLSNPSHQPYLFGQHITEADIRLYTTIARFDVAYHTIFLCNLKMIRHDYPFLSRWLRNLYWNESDRTNGGVFKKTTFFDVYKLGYLRARARSLTGSNSDAGKQYVVPRGPLPDIEPLTDAEEQALINGTTSLSLNTNGTSDASSNPFSAKPGQGMGALFGAETDSPFPDTESTTTDNTVLKSPGGADEQDGEPTGRQKIKRRTTYSEENQKWYKAAKKAEKQSGAPNLHLAL